MKNSQYYKKYGMFVKVHHFCRAFVIGQTRNCKISLLDGRADKGRVS